tara:strand:- start:272 stop:1108 length:837 start_codon:yes stop_codon:yes gene_type:complete
MIKLNNLKSFKTSESQRRCLIYRKKLLDISQTVTALHAGGALSSMEIVDFIYYGLIYNKKVFNGHKNTFIMSKGHGCMSQYIVLNHLGIIKDKILNKYCKPDGILGCHPDYGNPGIEASTGSLGHGMGLATGMAYFEKIKKTNNKIFVVLSDGELQEGSTWESMMMAANLELDNLICFLDHNGSQSFGITKATHPKFYPISSKIKSFNWSVSKANGHNVKSISDSLKKRIKNKPHMTICNTIKGKGVSFMENKPIWHYRSPNKEEYKIALNELKLIHS